MNTDIALHILNSIGLFFNIVGAWLVAIEVVRQYKGKKYRDNISIDEANEPARETPQYQKWEESKYKWMKWGLVFLTLGFLLQIISNAIYFF